MPMIFCLKLIVNTMIKVRKTVKIKTIITFALDGIHAKCLLLRQTSVTKNKSVKKTNTTAIFSISYYYFAAAPYKFFQKKNDLNSNCSIPRFILGLLKSHLEAKRYAFRKRIQQRLVYFAYRK